MDSDTSPSQCPPRRKPWQLLSVRIAIAVTLLGAGMWAYALATASRQAAVPGGGAGATSLTPAGPATLKVGLSFLGGFTIAYLMRKFLRWSLLIVAVIVGLTYVLRKTGVVELPWDQIKGGVESGASWLESQAGSVKCS
jgi:uncharacterized membrane protein (Fun14 family)